MKPYVKPEIHFVPNTGNLSGKEIANLSDEELLEYLTKNKFFEEKKKYRIKDGYLMREIAGENTIISSDPNNEMENGIMSPNGSASLMWEVFQKPSTKEDAVQQVVAEYNVKIEKARNAVQRFVNELLQYKVLEETE